VGAAASTQGAVDGRCLVFIADATPQRHHLLQLHRQGGLFLVRGTIGGAEVFPQVNTKDCQQISFYYYYLWGEYSYGR
jgi:hypothetical protein